MQPDMEEVLYGLAGPAQHMWTLNPSNVYVNIKKMRNMKKLAKELSKKMRNTKFAKEFSKKMRNTSNGPQPEEQVVIENDQVQAEELVVIENDQVQPEEKAEISAPHLIDNDQVHPRKKARVSYEALDLEGAYMHSRGREGLFGGLITIKSFSYDIFADVLKQSSRILLVDSTLLSK
ncbi:hypothetical protein L195_g009397 [Trifolium pratense]|uniref:Uncharacterized protein n=1 Tax=Trifolium pratense TaxID=57577 RepID=A0A2K3PBU5_TRIPR|nr:hypothetical protein L195_g009397 [Trifolium pratense]